MAILLDPAIVMPTATEVKLFREKQFRGRSTIRVIALPTSFGPIVPHRGDPITVDLDDPAINIVGTNPDAAGAVSGVVTNVKEAVAHPAFTTLTRVQSNTPTASIQHHLHVDLFLDGPLLP